MASTARAVSIMSFLRSRVFVFYVVGILCVAAGAQVSYMTGWTWPMAAGSATAVMATWGLVKAIRARRRTRPGD